VGSADNLTMNHPWLERYHGAKIESIWEFQNLRNPIVHYG
jgi:hypothetical protein